MSAMDYLKEALDKFKVGDYMGAFFSVLKGIEEMNHVHPPAFTAAAPAGTVPPLPKMFSNAADVENAIAAASAPQAGSGVAGPLDRGKFMDIVKKFLPLILSFLA